MPYNLPPPWDPGFALPDNVRDEGLERRAFVTRWLPRGTYDAPHVGNGGYAVPEYIMGERYGQGARVTKWMPRGTQARVPHYLDDRPRVVRQVSEGKGAVAVTMQPLSGTEAMPALYNQFGARAAQLILSRVAQVPKDQRRTVLKQLMDAIDPTLWGRVAPIAEDLKKRGVPAPQALARALAQAMSTGIAKEIVQTGLRRSAPQSRSLLALGIAYGRQALGADVAALAPRVATASTSTPLILSVATGVQSTGPQEGDCDATGTKIWRITDGVGHWSYKRSGEVCKRVTAATGQTTDTRGTTTVNGVPLIQSEGPRMLVGPFEFPVGARSGARMAFTQPVKADVANYFTGLYEPLSKALTPDRVRLLNGASALGDGWTIVNTDGTLFGKPGQQIPIPKGLTDGRIPIGKFTEPTTQQKWGVYLADVNKFGPGSGALVIRKLEETWLGAVFSWIKELVVKIVNAVGDIVDAIGEMACKVITSDIGAAAAGAASTTLTGNPAAGAAGAAIAANQCSSPTPAPPPPVAASESILPVALAAGGVVLLAVLLKKKKAP